MGNNRFHDKLVADLVSRVKDKHDGFQLEAELWVRQELVYVADLLTFDRLPHDMWWVTAYEAKTGWSRKTVPKAMNQAQKYFTWLDHQSKYVGNNFVLAHKPRGSRHLRAERWTRKEVMDREYWS